MKKILLVSFLSVAFTAAAVAQVKVEDPWVRATIGTQLTSGAFMTLTSATDARLVDVRTPIAEVAEIHEMALENNVMRMRALEALALPAGKAAVLRPGGYHVMLMGLKAPLKAGEQVSLTLTVEGANGKRENIEVRAPVRAVGGNATGHDAMRGH